MFVREGIIIVFCLTLLNLRGVYNAKILFVAVTPAVSHQKPFQQIWKQLSLKGHEVYVLSPSPLKDPALTNLTEYDISDTFQFARGVFQKDPALFQYLYLKKPDFFTVFKKDPIVTKLMSELAIWTFEHPQTKKLLKEHTEFDACLIEWLYPTLSSLGAFFKCPIIGVSSLGAPIPALDTVGNPSHPVIAPDHNLPVSRDMSFKERVLSFLWSIYVRLNYHTVVLPREDRTVKKYLGEAMPYIGDIERNVSLILLNRNPVLHRPIPLYPNVIELGGIKYERVVQTLEPDLQNYLDKSSRGVVYFSMGSFLPASRLPKSVLNSFKRVFSRLPYNVVWKYDADEMPDKPDNVYIGKWFPQTALLNHTNVKLFITQGGLQSLEEAISSHTPIIGIPFHSDQTTNVDTCRHYGMGKVIDLEDITEDKLFGCITEIMTDASYQENAKKLDELINDRPSDGLETAVWWTEYVIKHKGAPHLRSIAVNLPWWKYLMLDILIPTLVICVIFVYVNIKIIKTVMRFVRFLVGSKKDKPIQKKLQKQKKNV